MLCGVNESDAFAHTLIYAERVNRELHCRKLYAYVTAQGRGVHTSHHSAPLPWADLRRLYPLDLLETV